MFEFFLLLLIPLAIALGCLALFHGVGKVTWGEFALLVAAPVVILLIGFAIAYGGRTSDTEVWNGQIIEKLPKVPVSCEHSYECNCHYVEDCTGTGKNRSCSPQRVCDTCYEHLHDYDWDLRASTGESTSIDRIDRQGLDMPPRWGAAYIGEPYSSEHTFTNYIKANPDSVLLGSKGDMQRFGKLVPQYPDHIYDYYKHDPVINMGVPGVDTGTWNWLIREVNKQLGPAKQVNVIVILVPTTDRNYMLALKDVWVGGKKNDVDVVIGSQDGHTIGFADVMSWSTNKAMAIHLKNRIQDIGTLDKKDDIQQAILTTVKAEFVRMHMKDMKWLMRSFQPSTTTLIWLLIIAVLVEAGLAWWAVANDITENSGYSRRYRY